QGAILTVLALLVPRDRPWRFFGLAAAGTVVAYGIAATFAYQELRSLRARFPIESLEARLPTLPPLRGIPLASVPASDVAQTEDWVGVNWHGGKALNDLHENAVEIFLSRPGFGVSRLYMGIDRALSDDSPIDPSSAKSLGDERAGGARMAPLAFTGDPG